MPERDSAGRQRRDQTCSGRIERPTRLPGREIGPGPVLVRDLGHGQRPGNGERRVVVAHAVRRLGRVKRGDRGSSPGHRRTGSGSRGRSPRARRAGGGSPRSARSPAIDGRSAIRRRRSMMTSQIAPATHLTTFTSPCGARWKCMPRKVPFATEWEVLCCTNCGGQPLLRIFPDTERPGKKAALIVHRHGLDQPGVAAAWSAQSASGRDPWTAMRRACERGIRALASRCSFSRPCAPRRGTGATSVPSRRRPRPPDRSRRAGGTGNARAERSRRSGAG